MAATATILSPQTGDTVGLTVTISVAYAGFTGETLNCKIGSASDPSPPTLSGDGLHECSVTTTSPPPVQTVTTFADTTELDAEPNVNVTAGDTPITIEEVVIEEDTRGTKNKKKLKKVKGKVPTNSTATKVVCKVNRVDAQKGSMTEVGSEEGVVKQNKMWEVEFNPVIELDTEGYIQYFTRACALQNNAQLGCESKPVKK